MYRSLTTRIYKLAVSPKTEWAIVAHENKETTDVLTTFVLPLLGVAAVATFVHQLWQPDFLLIVALRQSAATFVGLLAGLYAAHWLCKSLFGAYAPKEDSNSWFALITYSSGIYYIAETFVALFPFLWWIRLALVITAISIWHWSQARFESKPILRETLALLGTLCIGLIPQIVFWIFGLINQHQA